LQKLYEKEKERTDTHILTFNVDDEIGGVTPYLKQNKYTFPVLFAKDLVNDLIPNLGIPQNWLVNADGKWLWTNGGFGDGDGWEKDILDRLNSAIVK
jgi:hypothetical protein